MPSTVLGLMGKAREGGEGVPLASSTPEAEPFAACRCQVSVTCEQVHRPQVVVHTHPYQAVEDQGMGLGAGCRQLSLQPGQLLPCVGVQGSPAQGCFVSHRCHKCRVQA